MQMQIQRTATSAVFGEKATRCRLLAANTGDNGLAKELATLADRYEEAARDLE